MLLSALSLNCIQALIDALKRSPGAQWISSGIWNHQKPAKHSKWTKGDLASNVTSSEVGGPARRTIHHSGLCDKEKRKKKHMTSGWREDSNFSTTMMQNTKTTHRLTELHMIFCTKKKMSANLQTCFKEQVPKYLNTTNICNILYFVFVLWCLNHFG